jgi:hypothetical protein
LVLRAVAGQLAILSVIRRRRRGLLEITAPPTKACATVEIEVSGARIRVEPGVELAALLSALRGVR